MALLYRVMAFGEPKGPWRANKHQVQQDAVAQGLGSYDEWGQFFFDAPAGFQWVREDDVKRVA